MFTPFRACVLVLLVTVTVGPLDTAVWAAEPGTVSFNRDIRPILSENCFHCHGPDDQSRAAGLRLDTFDGATDWAIVPGESSDSEVMARILTKKPGLVMPPPDSERTLAPEQVELIRRWIDEGAEYQGHWSFIPAARPEVPGGADPVDSHPVDSHPVDQFIKKQLDAVGLSPAPPASKETLIRRATFDLIGLPPTIDEIDAFLADDSPAAYEKLLDGLLARDQFGERMAADWLDAARYSDSYGYQVDRDRFVWPWRDWVVRSLNANMPYDQFITEQLAGDLLPGATPDQILATTFNRLHPQKVEGGSVPEEFRIEYIADRTQTVATAMMGLTYECCRCHNHKYDPISQSEYFQLTAFFDNIDEAGLYSYFTDAVPTPTLPLVTPEQKRELEAAEKNVRVFESAKEEVRERHAEFWRHQIESGQFTNFEPAEAIYRFDFEKGTRGGNRLVDGVRGKAFELSGDDAVATSVGNFDRSDPFSVSLWIKTPDVKERAVVFHRSRAWTDAASRGYEVLIQDGRLAWSLIHFWPGNAISIRTIDPIPVGSWVHVAVSSDGSSRAAGLRIFVDGRPASVEVVRDKLTKNITGGGGDTIAVGERFRDRGFKGGQVDQLRVFDVALSTWEAARLAGQPTDDLDILIEHAFARHDWQAMQVASTLEGAVIAKCRIEDALQEIMVMRELDEPRPSHILARGDYSQPGEIVSPGTPESLLPFPPDAARNRLGLARWLCDPRHPLTSRVAVNRLWQMLFGHGLVRTPEDFGSQGSPPSHPELLDWLAVEYVQVGWDTKAMLKQIMMSRTYRQSSRHPDPEVEAKDPTGVLLARFPTYRLPAEMLRDQALAISGRLVARIGGPPAKPYEVEASFKPVKRDSGDGLYRRSLYTYWKRTSPAPVMMTLDASTRDVCRVQRERTASPLQAFVMLNGPQYVEASRGLAERLVGEIEADQLAGLGIERVFRTLTSRRPSEREASVLAQLYRSQLDSFRGDASRVQSFLGIGDAAPVADLDGATVAAMTVVVGTLMNFDASMVKR